MSELLIGNPIAENKSRKLFVDPALVNERLMAVDIGNAGGICVNIDGKLIWESMPEDINKRWEIYRDHNPTIIVAENVHAFAGQGIVSTGTLLKNRGQVEMAIAAVGALHEFINPLNWIKCYTMKRKKHFKRTKEELAEMKKNGEKPFQWKDHLVSIAQDLLLVNERIDKTTADAILIWNYYAALRIQKPLKPQGLQFSFDL